MTASSISIQYYIIQCLKKRVNLIELAITPLKSSKVKFFDSFGAYHAAFMLNFPKHPNFINF